MEFNDQIINMEVGVMKGTVKLLSISLIALTASSASLAVSPIYVGGSLGYAIIDTPNSNVFSTATPDPSTDTIGVTATEDTRGSLGGSAYIGYDLNKTWAVELGYTVYGESNYKSTQTQSGTNDGTNTSKLSYDTHTYDLFLKGSTPISGNFSAFGKLGVSYVLQNNDYSTDSGYPVIPVDTSEIVTPKSGSNTYTAFRPAAAFGATYNFNPTVSTSLFMQGFLGEGDFDSDQDAIASSYLVGVAFNFHFS